MRRFRIGSLAASVVALLTYGCSTVDSPRDAREAVGRSGHPLLHGTGAGADAATVAIFLDGYARVCSGTLITPRWVLTSSTCVPADGGDDMRVQTSDDSGAFPSRILTKPALNVALVELGRALPMTPAVRPLYNADPKSLVGQTVTAYGAGNGSTTNPKPDPMDLGLRQGSFTVTAPKADGYALQGAGGVALVAGDEGGGSLYSDGKQTYLTGVHVKDASGAFYDVSSRVFHDWVMEQIFGVKSYPDDFSRNSDDGMLITDYSAQKTWDPCAGGSYAWSALSDFGADATGSIATGLTTTDLTGTPRASGHATGALTINVKTTASEVWGLRSLTATCDAASLTCLGTECVTSPTGNPSQTATSTWTPCGADGCFAWGATLAGTPPGDWMTVDGVKATSSTAPGAVPTAATCGTVRVDAVVGAAAGSRTQMDVWAICGCDDEKHTCATTARGNKRCGTRANQCGLSYECGTCAAGATCEANECVCPAGWIRNGDGSCTKNNCATNNGGCDTSATCTNDPAPGDHAVSCACHSGYTGNGYSCTRAPQAAMTMNVAPAVASTPNGALFLATDLDGRVYSNRVILGQGGQGWLEVGTNGRTNASPAAAVAGNSSYVFVAIKGLGTDLYLNQADLGGAWVGWQRMGGIQTSYAPAVATTPDGVLFFATALDGRIYYNRTVLGQGGQGWIEVGGNGRTDAAPAAALCGNNPYIFAAVKGTDGYVYINQAGLGGPWVGWRTDRTIRTDVAPAVATTPDGVLFFAKDLQGRIFSNRVVLGQGGQGWVEVGGNGRTDAAPAAALVGNNPYIFAAMKGLNGRFYLNQAGLGGPWVGWR